MSSLPERMVNWRVWVLGSLQLDRLSVDWAQGGAIGVKFLRDSLCVRLSAQVNWREIELSSKIPVLTKTYSMPHRLKSGAMCGL